jgi:dTDP-4-amino-4,6-dideoxygalactose transaminase
VGRWLSDSSARRRARAANRERALTIPSDRRAIQIAAPALGPDVEAAVMAVLRSAHIAQGPVVRRLEEQCAAMAGTRHAVAVCNGTAALEASLEILGVGPGDEVITSALTFAATINAVLRSGATVRFADIGDDFTVDPDAMRSLVNERTRVLLPVHLYGLMADMDGIGALAATHGLPILEDAAQAHGASQGQRRAGGSGLGCFSFYATKNVTSAEGGVITTSDDGMAARLRILRNQGMERRYEYVAVGRNLRLTDLAAAVAVPQMDRLAEINAARDRNARALIALLGDQPSITLPHVPAGRTHVWHQFTVLLAGGVERERVIGALADRGVGSGVYYPRLVWDHECYRSHPGVAQDKTPRAADVAARCLSLPVHQNLAAGDLERIAAALIEATSS